MSEKDLKQLTETLTSTILISIKKYTSEKRTLQNKESLIPFILCEQDNFNKTPEDMRYSISLIPLTIEEIEKMPEYRDLCQLFLSDEFFDKVFPVDIREEVCNIMFPLEYLISIVWRYINQYKTLDWAPHRFEDIFESSYAIWKTGSITVKFIIPLLGLSGRYYIPEIKINHKWYIRALKQDELSQLSHVNYYFKLPATMCYTGEAPPTLSYGLICDKYELKLSDLAAGWNVIKPESLPLNEIRYIISVLQASTSVGEYYLYSINSPVVIYKSDQWAANPFGNPFSIFYAWPLNNCIPDRSWFAPPVKWVEWVKRNFAFVEGLSADQQKKYIRALRWFSKSIECDEIDERLISLFIAVETLCLDKKGSRGKGELIGEICSKALTGDIKQQRKWRKYIRKLYERLRNRLVHDGIDTDTLNLDLAKDPDLADAGLCADMLETAFRGTWNSFVQQ